jgi:hypothetical protein
MQRTAMAIVAGAAMVVAGIAMAQAPEKKPLQVQETNFEGVTAEVTEVTRKEGVLTVKVRFRNTGAKPTRIYLLNNGSDVDKFYAVAGTTKMMPLRDSQKVPLMTPADGGGSVGVDIKPGGSYLFWSKYPAPPASAKKVTFMTPHAAPFEDLPITEAQ